MNLYLMSTLDNPSSPYRLVLPYQTIHFGRELPLCVTATLLPSTQNGKYEHDRREGN